MMEETINGKSVKIKKPNRVSHTYKQTIKGSIEQIFPLYCPVKELLWTESWNPEIVYSNSGVVEQNAIFTSRDGNRKAIWYVTTYDIENGHVEMIKIMPDYSVSKLEITVEPSKESTTSVFITYTITSLNEEGDIIFKGFTKENFDISMQAWEKAMNHYLKTGELLSGLPEF